LTKTYISLDIETTGLDPANEAILEFAAVRFSGSQILDTYSTLVDPGRAIPYNIQQLTGITPRDIMGAPTMQAILPDLRRFVGDTPIIGHNIQFDLGFLRAHGLFSQNAAIDTFELATILLPQAKRYSLTALIKFLHIKLPDDGQAHRALYDATVAQALFSRLLDEARQLDDAILHEFVLLAEQGKENWPLSMVFRQLKNERSVRRQPAPLELTPKEAPLNYKPLKPVNQPQDIDTIALCRMLEQGGLFDQTFSGFEHRSQQVDMLSHVAEAFNTAHHAMIEAGTGTGKSIAYLLPAIHWAIQNGQRVVVSTNTINLQDQLLGKDIPSLQKILPFDFKAVVLKGRNNYVCPKRVLMFMTKGQHSVTELRLLCKLLVWLPQTNTGDREELFLRDKAEEALWWQVASDGLICTARTCTAETCFYARARRAAEAAHVIIVNHALLLADVAVDGHIIPDYKHLIIDEAHHVEDNITSQLSFFADQRGLEQLLRDLSQTGRGTTAPQGYLQTVANRCMKVGSFKAKQLLIHLTEQGHEVVTKAQKSTQQLFRAVTTFAADFSKHSRYDQKIRLTEQSRKQPTWSSVTMTWAKVSVYLAELSKLLSKFNSLLTELEDEDIEGWEDLLSQLGLYRSELDNYRKNLQLIISEPTADRICWVETDVKNNQASLHHAPLHVGTLFEEYLLKTKDTVILTSATIRTNGSFAYFKERLHLKGAEEAAVGSPFDYVRNTLLYLPTDMPMPETPQYPQAMAQALIELAKQIKGRMLVLFTSYLQLKQTAEAITGPLAEAHIKVYEQGVGGSRVQLLDNFKSADQGILLGTRSFWEGVDIPGAALSCVVITKIPFAVPSDPIIAARSETFNNAFNEYSMPLAILTFRQGFGRLIRTKTDRGVVVVLDRRMTSKSYGQVFIDSLPKVTKHYGLLSNLPEVAERWIEPLTD